MPPRQKSLRAVDGVDNPLPPAVSAHPKIQPLHHFRLADALAQRLRQKPRRVFALLVRNQRQKLLARFFRDDAIVRVMPHQRSADDGLRSVISDGHRFFVIASCLGIGDEILLLHAAAQRRGIAQGSMYSLHWRSFCVCPAPGL